MPKGFFDPMSYLRYQKPNSDWMEKIMQQILSQQSSQQSQDWLPFVQQILAQNWNRPSEEQLGSSKNWLLNLLGIKDINSNTSSASSASNSRQGPTTYHYNPETKQYEPVFDDWNPEGDIRRIRDEFVKKRTKKNQDSNSDSTDNSELADLSENYFRQWQDYLSRVFSRQHYFNPEEMQNMLSQGGAGYRNVAAGDIGGLAKQRQYQGAGYGSGPIVKAIGDVKGRLSQELGGMGLDLTALDRSMLEDWKKAYIGPSMDMARMWKELYELLSDLELTQTEDEDYSDSSSDDRSSDDDRYYPGDYDTPTHRYDPFDKYRRRYNPSPESLRPRAAPPGGYRGKGRFEPPPRTIPPGLPFSPPGRGPRAQRGKGRWW